MIHARFVILVYDGCTLLIALPNLQRYEEERQARLEYFRKLDGYQMQKENVYVV
jgi:hypothetical protein